MNIQQTDTRDLASALEKLATEIPDTIKQYSHLVDNAAQAKALDPKTMALIALGVGISQNAHECIVYYLNTLKKLNVQKDEILDVIQLTIGMQGGTAIMPAFHALKIFEELSVQQSKVSAVPA